jgi:hypothetical protein
MSLEAEFPDFAISSNLHVVATEESSDACTPQSLYVGTVRGMALDIPEIMAKMPHWILDYVIKVYRVDQTLEPVTHRSCRTSSLKDPLSS